ncbi:MAG: cyclic nucleotide-binding domain-containing protein [Rhodospirillaceae bacterium]
MCDQANPSLDLRTTRVLAVGEVLFREGDCGDNAYIIDTGLLEISRQAGRAEMIIGTAKAGEMVGEMALIDSQPRSATAKALKPTTLTVIPKTYFDEALASTDPAVRHLLERFVTIIRSMTDRNVRLTLGLR